MLFIRLCSLVYLHHSKSEKDAPHVRNSCIGLHTALQKTSCEWRQSTTRSTPTLTSVYEFSNRSCQFLQRRIKSNLNFTCVALRWSISIWHHRITGVIESRIVELSQNFQMLFCIQPNKLYGNCKRQAVVVASVADFIKLLYWFHYNKTLINLILIE